MDHFSKSAFDRYSICEANAYLYYEHGLGHVSNEAGAKGAAVHDLRARVGKGELPLADIFTTDIDPETAALAMLTIANEPLQGEECQWQYEVRVEMDEEGNVVPSGGAYICILDRVGVLTSRPYEIIVEELKTGRSFHEPDIEMFMEVWAAQKLFNDFKPVVRFFYYYPVLRRTVEHEFLWRNGDELIIKRTEEGSEPTERRMEWYGDRSFIEYFRPKLNALRRMDMNPRPGFHCENWYGSPCPFLGAECPITQDVIAKALPTLVTDTPFDMLAEKDKAGAAFAALLKDYPIEIATPEMVSSAYHGVSAVRAAANKVSSRIKAWCQYDNRAFSYDGRDFGLVNDEKINTMRALEMLMEAKVTIEDMARVVSVSKTGLKKLSRKEYGDLADRIIAETTTFGSARLGKR